MDQITLEHAVIGALIVLTEAVKAYLAKNRRRKRHRRVSHPTVQKDPLNRAGPF